MGWFYVLTGFLDTVALTNTFSICRDVIGACVVFCSILNIYLDRLYCVDGKFERGTIKKLGTYNIYK